MSTKTSAPNRAYILIDTETGRATELVGVLRQKPGVVTADMVDGPYAIVAVAEGPDVSAVAKTVLVDIMQMSGIKDVIVYMTAPETPAPSRPANRRNHKNR